MASRLLLTTTGEPAAGWNVDGGDVYYANGQGVSLAPGQYTVSATANSGVSSSHGISFADRHIGGC